MSIAKATTLLAKFHALSNASEFIRSHGEEGFSFQDENFDKVYKRETVKLSKKLDKMSSKFLLEYQKINIEINDEMHEDS